MRRFKIGETVWLRAMTVEETGDEAQPRQRAKILGDGDDGEYIEPDNDTLIVEVARDPDDPLDDGLREVCVDLIEE